MSARDRQDAMMGWLRGRAGATVDELAAAFEVSTRTAFRDLEQLRRRGVAIHGEPGRGGGVWLDSTQWAAPVALELEEMVGLILTLHLARRVGAPFAASTRTAVGKLMRALPSERARQLRRLLPRVLIGQAASPAVAESVDELSPGLLPRIEQAFTRKQVVAFAYRDRHGKATTREAEIHGLLAQHPAWYLLARDPEVDGMRMFRLDRMRRLRVLQRDYRQLPLSEVESLYRPYVQASGLDEPRID